MICVIIGGGAAGMFAAIRCKEKHPSAQVILLEKTNQLLSKVRISGGGRCNVTHHCFDPNQLAKHYPRGSKELIGPFHTFQAKDTVAWFEERGVVLKTEDDGRMFPITDSSETIINCLLHAANLAGVDIRKQQAVQSIQKKNERFIIELKGSEILADKLLLATGSSPWGHQMAREFGHRIIDPVPSLFTFNVPSSPLLDLAGIAVSDAMIELEGTSLRQKGPILLTHWGFSGPAVLKLSAWAARELHACGYKASILIRWLASSSQEEIYQQLLQQKQAHPLQALPPRLPRNLWNKLLSQLSIDPAAAMGKLSHKSLSQFAAKLHADRYLLEGKTTYKQEFVTAGGVDLKEIDCKTMQSKLVPGLFFAGEILNIDGVTGGFNFQNAWTTAWLAANAIE